MKPLFLSYIYKFTIEFGAFWILLSDSFEMKVVYNNSLSKSSYFWFLFPPELHNNIYILEVMQSAATSAGSKQGWEISEKQKSSENIPAWVLDKNCGWNCLDEP